MVIWLIGLSGAGKTTVGERLASRRKAVNPATVYLDGDILREVWRDSPGHTVEGRRINAERISHLCKMLDVQGIDVVCSILSIFPEWQAWNREHFSDYLEVYLKVPMECVLKRDVKGLYAKAFAGEMANVVGMDIEFPEPPNPDLVLDSSGASGTPDDLVAAIERALGERCA
ncbi:MAG: adenylyl-sulfate kinase [Desulfovibrio sp.]